MIPRTEQYWSELLRLAPGYDPYKGAENCWFDVDEAERALEFIPKYLCHVEGELAGTPFVLEPWQQCFIANVFGWKQLDSRGRKVRRYREALLYVPRKNGKTPLVAAIALYVLFCEGEHGQQNYIAAADKEQAGFLFRQCQGMVEHAPALSDRCRIYGGRAAAGQSKSIRKYDDGSFLRIVSADATTKHGGNSHLVIVDELHTQPTRELFDTLHTSIASDNRKQPLFISLTTADYDRPSICNEQHQYACDVRDGKIQDLRYFPMVFEPERIRDSSAGKADDWTAEETWRRCNPNVGVSVSLDYLRAECTRAQSNPALENVYKRLHLNWKTSSAIRSVIPLEQWDAADAGADPVAWREKMLSLYSGSSCFAALDLGSVSDLNAFVLLFETETKPDLAMHTEIHRVAIPWFWVPEGRVDERRKQRRQEYDKWIAQGFIKVTAGNETDYRTMREDISVILRDFAVLEMAVDRLFYGVQICQDMAADGYQIVAFGQGIVSMAAPTRQLLDDIAARRFHHGNNPVLRWQAGNAQGETGRVKDKTSGELKEVYKFSRDHSADKIDGLMAICMAYGRAQVVGYTSPSVRS